MSPTLFLLYMEYLSRLMIHRTSESDFRYHATCEIQKITHLVFADDLLLFRQGDLISMGVLARTIEEFTSISGLKVNKDQSRIFFSSNVAGFDKHQILWDFGYVEGNLPVKYLDIPLTSKQPMISHFSPLIKSITTMVNRWNNSHLSLAGRVELIRSCVQGVECFWTQSLPFPSGWRTGFIPFSVAFYGA